MTARLDPMPLVDPVRRFVLFTNPKCGGTTLKAWFFSNLQLGQMHRRPHELLRSFGLRPIVRYIRHGRALAEQVAMLQDRPDKGEEFKVALRHFIYFYRTNYCREAMQSPAIDDYFRICVVRNPYDRITSAFLDKMCMDGRFGREAPYVQRMLSERGGKDMTFREFLHYVGSLDESECPIHWRRQTYLIEGQRIDALVRLEALHDEMAAHAAVVGADYLPILRQKLQATPIGGSTRQPVEDLTDVPSLRIAERRAATGRLPPRASFLTEDTRREIRRIYAADFESLPYDDAQADDAVGPASSAVPGRCAAGSR